MKQNIIYVYIILYYTALRMESGRMMLLHSVIVGVLLYLFMVFILGEKQSVAENRSILLAALILAYMILFGHRLPTPIVKGLF
jgi:EamA domain-containing membrane protein RarD